MTYSKMYIYILIGVAIILILALVGWKKGIYNSPSNEIISGNGRIEATEIDISSKFSGRLTNVFVDEGDFVKADQVLAKIQIDALEAERNEIIASKEEALQSVASAKSLLSLKLSDVVSAKAQVAQKEAELATLKKRLSRTESLSKSGAISQQTLDDDRANVKIALAALEAAKAQVVAAEAAVESAKAQQIGTESRINVIDASIKRIDVDINDSILKAPRDGRVQLKIAQPGETISAGGRILNLIDLTDVYMTFFVPEIYAGRIAIGSEVRIILDTAKDIVVPAKVSFVGSQAQFTPKTVETASERQKLMFKVRAQLPKTLLRKYITQVKTGIPGVAWIKLNESAEWPDHLKVSQILLDVTAE